MAVIDPLDALIDSLPLALSRVHTARELTKEAREFGIEVGKFNTKTVEGRKQLSLAISIAKLTKLYDEKTDAPNLSAAEPAPGDPKDTLPGAVREGNGSALIRGHLRVGGAPPDAGGVEPITRSDGESVRRVTGSADIPLTEDGRVQVIKEATEKALMPFSFIIAAPNKRSRETASLFRGQNRQVEPALDGWARGSLEGQNAGDVNDKISSLIRNPNRVPGGVSPASGKPGVSYRKFTIPMLQRVSAVLKRIKPGQRGLLVTSGGNLQAIDAWLTGGMRPGFQLDYAGLANKPYASVTGKLFKLEPGGLKEVSANGGDGLYASEHGETEWNSKSGTGTEQSMPDALLAYDAATPLERRKLKRQVRDKVFASAKHRPGEFGQSGSDIRKLAQKYFSVQPPPPYVPHPLGSPQPIY